jgi:hypothetical protein
VVEREELGATGLSNLLERIRRGIERLARFDLMERQFPPQKDAPKYPDHRPRRRTSLSMNHTALLVSYYSGLHSTGRMPRSLELRRVVLCSVPPAPLRRGHQGSCCRLRFGELYQGVLSEVE